MYTRKECLVFVLRSLILALAVLMFTWQAGDVIKKYSDGYTTISTKTVIDKKIASPWMSFYPSNAFKLNKAGRIGIHLPMQHFLTTPNITSNNNDTFRNLTYILGVDFEVLIVIDGRETKEYQRLSMGKNILKGKQNETVEIWMHEAYGYVTGIYYTMEIKRPFDIRMDYVSIIISFNKTYPAEDRPEFLTVYLSAPNEHFGIANAYWYGIEPFSFTLRKSTAAQLQFKTLRYTKFETGNDPCRHYLSNDSMVLCTMTIKAHVLLKDLLSKCANPCNSVSFKTIMANIDDSGLGECKTDEDLACFMEVSHYGNLDDNQWCPDPCQGYEYTARIDRYDFVHPNGEFVLDFMPSSYRITVQEEVLLFDLATFIGSVGGSLGLFVGFSFYDFATFLSDKLVCLIVRK